MRHLLFKKIMHVLTVIIINISLLAFLNNSYAQLDNVADSLASFSSTENIDIESDHLEIDQETNVTIFTGNVKSTQKDINIIADSMIISYEKKPEDTINNDDNAENDVTIFKSDDVEFIDYKGNVTITTKTQIIKGDWAKIELKNDLLIVGDEATVDSKENFIKGGILEVNYKTKISKFRNENKGKRVKTTIKK